MVAMDTIAGGVSAGIATRAAVTLALGDSLAVRAYPDGSAGWLENMAFHAAVVANIGDFRVRSPRMHDNVTGLSFKPGEVLATYPMPAQGKQRLYPADNLIAEILGGAAAEFQELALFTYYDQLPGSDAPLASWGDIANNITNYKTFKVVCTAAAANTWSDTKITTTDDQLHADKKYAVLGFDSDTLMTAVGVKGQETGNLRACGPGDTDEFPTSEYFVRMSDKHGTPHIPVISANNRNGVFVSAISRAAIAGTETVTLVCVELN